MRLLPTLVLYIGCACSITAVTAEKLEKWDAINKFATASIHPGALSIAEDFSKASEFFSNNVRARIRSTANLIGFTDTVELIFGVKIYNITASSGPGSGAYYFSDYTIRQYSESKDSALVTIDYAVQPTPSGQTAGIPVSTLTTTVAMTFDNDGKIDQYDVATPNFGLNDYSLGHISPANLKAGAVGKICQAHEQYCTGSNQQYTNLADCQTQLGALPYGLDLVYNTNTVVCRTIWASIVHFRPNVHCPNLGPSGGARCLTSNTYPTYFSQSANLFPKSFVGEHK